MTRSVEDKSSVNETLDRNRNERFVGQELTRHTISAITPGTKWRNKRSGIVAEVVKVERDHVYLKREKRPSSLKWVDHFLNQYELLTDDLVSQEKSGG